MRLNFRNDPDALAFAVQRQRELEGFGREHGVVRKLDVDVECTAVFLFLQQPRKIRRVAGRHAADKNQAVLFAARAQLRAAAPADAIKTGFLERPQFFIN